MPTRLLLEGSDLQALLAQVRKEHGPKAKIVAADRVRAAGIMGLLSRQRYELTVEVDDSGPAAIEAEPAAPPAPAETPAPPAVSAKPPVKPPVPKVVPVPAAAVQTATSVPAPVFQAGLVHAKAALAAAAAPTNGSPLASPADALVALVEAQERRLRPAVGPDEAASAVDAMHAAEKISAGTAIFADVLANFAAPTPPESRPAATAARTATPDATTNATPATAEAGTETVETAVVAFAAAETTVERTVQTTAIAPFAPIAAPVLAAPPSLVAPYRPELPAPDAPLGDVLAHLGLPRVLAERVEGADSYRAVVRVLKALPEAPKAPRRTGDVLVVVGDLASATAVARTVGDALRLDPARTLLAAASCAGTGIHPSRRLAGPEQAAGRVARLRRDEGPLIVVVDAPADGSGSEHARAIIAAVNPAAVWAVVDATRKTPDTARLLADIGRVDAVAAYNCAVTGDPATVLQLGVPVAMLDGRTATPHAWAELMCRRLEEVSP